MEQATQGDELIEVVVRLPRKAIQDSLLSTRREATGPNQSRLEMAKSLLAGRRRRKEFFTGLRFADPSWDMILELYIAASEQRELPVTQLCELSGGSTTSALRQLEHMEAIGYVRRAEDPKDRRRLMVTMLPRLQNAADDWLDMQLVVSHLLL